MYQAKDTETGNICAIKEMSLSTVPANERLQVIQNFLAEAQILSHLNHPYLPAFTDFFTEGARQFLVMEYIDGSTLEDLLEGSNGFLPQRRVLGWARQLCIVMEYLHNRQPPVIFRDMKPGNVMLTRSGRIKLIDFGISRLFDYRHLQEMPLLGVTGFESTEQFGGSPIDERSDIYSLAMTLLQMLTHSISENGFDLTNVHTNFPHISPPVARTIEKATSPLPVDRFESIVEFRDALFGMGKFQFENGSEATTPEELAELCDHYLIEAADYLYAGEIESWLLEIGENDLARVTEFIQATEPDTEIGIKKLLRAITKSKEPVTNDVSNQLLVTTSAKTMKIFYCYAREDKILQDELVKHLSNLKRQRRITGWLDRNISAGKEWAQEIDENLNTAQIILLLVSPDFIASDYCYSIEMKRALERHYNGDARVIPVILRPVDWEDAPFSNLQVLPTGARPVTIWNNHDEAFLDIVKGIRKVVNELLQGVSLF